MESVLFGWANYADAVKQPPEAHQLKTRYTGKEIVNDLIPHFIGRSFDEIIMAKYGTAGLLYSICGIMPQCIIDRFTK